MSRAAGLLCLLGALLLTGCAASAPPPAASAPAGSGATIAGTVAASSAAPAAALPPAPSASPAPPMSVRVAWVALGGGFLPLHAAQERGFFERRGLNVELVFTTGPQAVQSLIAREVDVAYVDAAQMVRAGLAGADTVMLAANPNTLLFKLIAHPSLQRPEDLRGKRLGITRLGTTSDFAARYLLPRLGLTPDGDVAIVQTGGSPEVLLAMAAGAVDAGLSNEPVVHQARKQGYIVLYDFATLGLEMPQNSIGTLKSLVEERPEAFRRLIGGLVEAMAWTKHHRVEALEVLARYTRLDDPELLAAAYDEHIPRLPQAPYVTEAGVRTVLDSIRDSEPRAADARPASFIDDRFIRELEESGYIKSLYP